MGESSTDVDSGTGASARGQAPADGVDADIAAATFGADAFERAAAGPPSPESEAAQRKAAKRYRRRGRLAVWSSLLVILLIAGGMVGFTYYKAHHKPPFVAPVHVTKLRDGLLAGGAGLTRVDVYVDYQCTQCRGFIRSVGGPLEQFAEANTITLIYHPLALLNADSTAQYSTRAAASAACASDLDAFQSYSNLLFSHQPKVGSAGLSDDQLVQLGASTGMINPAFASCVRTGKYAKWVANQNALAATKGVTVAPAILVNGTIVGTRGATPTLDQVTAAVGVRAPR